MPGGPVRQLIALACLLVPVVAHAQDAPTVPSDAGVEASDAGIEPAVPADAATPTPAELAARIDALEQAQDQLGQLQRSQASTREQVKSMLPMMRFITVWIDVGAFAVGGNGSGIRSDIGHRYYPGYADQISSQWVFMGDDEATAINANGEPADLSDSREQSVDTVHSGGHPSVIANSVGLSIGKDVGSGLSIVSLVELLPRSSGNILDIELANIQYRPWHEHDLWISAGKVDSVLGVEYRTQDAPDRLGVTPSLICRYTCGRPFGVEARLNEGPLSLSAALTDGDSFNTRFEPEPGLKSNDLPTGSAHVQWKLPIAQGLELGVSGAVGPQDGQPDNSLVQWHYGFDAKLSNLAGFEATVELVQGHQPGSSNTATPCMTAQCLTYKGAYILVDRHVETWLTPYVRVDWRDAVHRDGVEFVYESHTLRATVGAHVNITRRIVAKAEYTYVRELGAIPQFPDDVLTSSLVISTD
jgi:hypothetical protein